MEVKLISYTKNPESVVALAARTTYTQNPPSLGEIHNGETDAETIRRVMSYGHVSIVEHAHFTFLIEGVSRSLTHQLVRHRIASFSQQSQRYVKFSEKTIETVAPPTVSKDIYTASAFAAAILKSKEMYDRLIELGVPPEDARFVLPNAATSNIMMTMNARELLHFFKLRCCNRAQWEIRELANKMLNLVREVAPTIFEKGGPSCVQLGYCPEGELSCGRVRRQKNDSYRAVNSV